MVGKDALLINECTSPLRKWSYPHLDTIRAQATALSGIDQALWDAMAKHYKLPLYKLYGADGRTRIPLYANLNKALRNNRSMAATLDQLHHSPRFLETDTATVLSEMIEAEYQTKISKKLAYRLRKAHLEGCPQELKDCVDSSKREYLPNGITSTLSSLDFIKAGLNVCILGPSDSGKSFYSKAIGIKACARSVLSRLLLGIIRM